MSELLRVSFEIPFSNKRHAEIAYDVLRIDPEPKRSFITKTLAVEDNKLTVQFSGEHAKNVRVGVTAFFESLLLCCETMNEFGVPAKKYEHY